VGAAGHFNLIGREAHGLERIREIGGGGCMVWRVNGFHVVSPWPPTWGAFPVGPVGVEVVLDESHRPAYLLGDSVEVGLSAIKYGQHTLALGIDPAGIAAVEVGESMGSLVRHVWVPLAVRLAVSVVVHRLGNVRG
jgi:hypothetical protein